MATLSDLRTRLAAMSGRYDLIDVGANPDATFYLNQGQKLLDLLLEREAEARHFTNLTAGQILIPVDYLRSIKEVWIYDTEKRTELIRESAYNLRSYYNKPAASTESGTPEYYAPVVVRPHPKTLTAEGLNQQWSVQDMKLTGFETYNGILVMPPVDVSGKYTIEVWGKFFTQSLSQDEDISWYTINHELLLLMAAMYWIEVVNRNSEGAADWMKSMNNYITEIIKDQIQDEITGITSMEIKTYEV